MSLLEVFFEIEAKDWGWLISTIVLRWLIKLCPNQKIDLSLVVHDAFCKFKWRKFFVPSSYLLVEQLLAVQHELLE